MRFILAIALSLAFAGPAAAITFSQGKEPDPFAEGKTCPVQRLMSYGGYIYSYPSKYDLVFEPFVSYIWHCPESGYVSYAADFGKLSQEEKKRIAAYLSEHPWRPAYETAEGFQAKLDHLEAIYALREQTRKERAWFLRARAWLYGDDPRADEYRAKALKLHKKMLQEEDPQGAEKIENLYLAGFYSWKLGDREAAEAYFKDAQAVKWTDEEGTEHTGAPYINGLIDEIKAGKAADEVRFGGGDSE